MGEKGAEWTGGSGFPTQEDDFVFCGESTHPVDAKNRVFVPKRFQLGLPLDSQGQRSAVLCPGPDGCLYLMSSRAFTHAFRNLNTDAFAPKPERMEARQRYSLSERLTLDGSGRLLLSARLAGMAGIGKEVVLVGVMDRIEVWAPERWAAFQVGADGAELEALDELLSGRSRTEEEPE